MPPRKSSSKVPAHGAAKPRARRSARPEEAEPTAAQKVREERKEKLRIAKMRQKLFCERPSQLEDEFIVETTLFPQKRPAYPSYDESPNKRRRARQGPNPKKRARRAPWEKDARFKKPPSPLDSPVGTTPRDQDAIDALGGFASLPAEVRDEILRYILLWPHEIAVFSGWSRVFPRSRPRLDLSIMYTCRVLRDQGLRILFGENSFTYDSRDPVASHDHTNPMLEKVFGHSVMPINEHGHLIRHIKVKVHRSRVHFSEHRQTFENAVLKFLPGGGLAQTANLHTLTLEVPAECNRDLQSISKTGSPDDVPICQYLRSGSRISEALFKLQVQWVRVLAWDRFGECWETKVDMRDFVKDEQMRLEYMTLSGEKHSSADDINNLNIPRDPVAAARYRPKDVEAMQKRWHNRVNNAVGKLRSLAWRIEGLVLNPNRAIHELQLWKHVTPPKAGAPGSDERAELASLPSDYREHSYATRSSSSRSRRVTVHSNPSIELNPEVLTDSHAKASTTARASFGQLTIFQKKDTAREARLIRAQHSTRENETGPEDKGMLTAEWLENLEEPDAEDTQAPMINDDLEAIIVEVEQHEKSK
ncbi:hypothetical protein O1611_g3551 [Lasiodiplodia mahajangana]|uniref:Uncharacterized protein n=1 Tax=Lasiodiplodia mahajangana TaxID=1108764 RepID=A0ACC2JS43_9PEZI|nr:hypothetical protein O1611_g3551 [Lasiodiplodia mahajangana]